MKQATIEKINEAALKLFAQKGMAATSAGEIAEKAGISAGLMYHYYKSKEELNDELVKMAITGAEKAIMDIAEMEIAPHEKIKRLTGNFISELSKKKSTTPYYYLLMSQALLATELSPSIKKHRKQLYSPFDAIAEIIAEGQKTGTMKQGDPMSLTIMYMAAFNGLCSYKLMLGRKFMVPDSQWMNAILIDKNI